jgi:hypothetical protein
MDYEYHMTMSNDSARIREAERAIVLQLLRGDHTPRWSRRELERELGHLAPLHIQHALTGLSDDGIVELEGETICAARPARRLDALELIAI